MKNTIGFVGKKKKKKFHITESRLKGTGGGEMGKIENYRFG